MGFCVGTLVELLYFEVDEIAVLLERVDVVQGCHNRTHLQVDGREVKMKLLVRKTNVFKRHLVHECA